jgi:SAM-dependent methyltransferase
MINHKGPDRERGLPLNQYFSDDYFKLPQLFSFAQQIFEIHNMQPTSILEIGKGNGMLSTYLSNSGFNVVTADINPNLKPDICASLDSLPSLNLNHFDLVVCCEVLEHLPLSTIENNIKTLAALGNRLFLTLPNYKKSFGFFGLFRLPKLDYKPFKFGIDIKVKKILPKEHFWEVDSCKNSSRFTICKILHNFYKIVKTRNFILNPYHISFKCE